MTALEIDRRELAELARTILEQEWSSERRRAAIADGGVDARLDAVLVDVGWPALLVPEEHGGYAGRLGDVEPLLVELGRRATVGTFAASGVVTTTLLRHAGSGVQHELFPGLISGQCHASYALHAASGAIPPVGCGVRADRDGSGWVLDGAAAFVPHGVTASAIVVLATTVDGWRGFVVPSEAITARPVVTWDATRQYADVFLERVELGPDRELRVHGEELLAMVIDVAAYTLACDSVGLASHLVRATAEYGMERVQFGRPIGSFQAWKHYAANMHIAAVAARAAVARATRAFDHGESVAAAASVAKLVAGDAAETVASWATQLHGGIAYTWEHDTHIYLKRAKLNQLLVGSGDYHRERIARTLE